MLSLCWCEAWLVLLVDDCIESLVEEDDEALAAVTRCGDVHALDDRTEALYICVSNPIPNMMQL